MTALAHFGWLSPDHGFFEAVTGWRVSFDCFYQSHRTAVFIFRNNLESVGLVLHHCMEFKCSVEFDCSEDFKCVRTDAGMKLLDERNDFEVRFESGRVLPYEDLEKWRIGKSTADLTDFR